MTACALDVNRLACLGIYFPKQFKAVMFVELILCTGCCDGDVEGLWDLHEKPAAYYQRNWSVGGPVSGGRESWRQTPVGAEEWLPWCFL